MRRALLAVVLMTQAAAAAPATLAPGYWNLDQTQPILDKTLTIRLAPDLSLLDDNERAAVERLLEAGAIFQELYESSRHPQALTAHRRLIEIDRKLGSPEATRNLLQLYRLFQGPIATTLDNRRLPFLPVDSITPGKNVYPPDAAKLELDAWMAAHPSSRGAILHPRTVVVRTTPRTVAAGLATLRAHPALDVLHPDLRPRLESLRAARRGRAAFHVLPYAVAYAPAMLRVHALLLEAAARVAPSDEDFARTLRHRARDLLANDYEAGDAYWVTGRYGDLDAAIGAYETYDDELYGTKAFFGLSLMLRDRERSAALRGAIKNLQAIEDALPYARHKRIREDIPVGVYRIIADFGQARGTNTATILPNESHTARRFGRTILMRYDILTHPDLVAAARAQWEAALAPTFHADFSTEGGFQRTLWHEIGHYLGVDRDAAGRELDTALEANSPTFEEMKADLVALFAAPALHRDGYYDDAALRAVYASGILRTLQKVKPRRDQPYQTMQLMQMNFFLAHGLLRFEPAAGRLHVDYARYHAVVTDLLREVLAVQDAGDKPASDAFIDRWTGWADAVHGALGRAMRATETSRFRLVRYAALGE
jgi:hypothetical protein